MIILMDRRIAVRGIFVKDGRLLCVKLKPYDKTGSGASGDFWCTIGGGVDVGESLVPALEREILEETGIRPIVGNLLYVQQFMHNNREHIELFFNITNVEDYTQIDLSKTTHGAKEIAEIAFIDTAAHTVMPKFLTELDFSRFNPKLPTQFYSYIP
jgi:8-oxo-dGTP pyrophosphatase MutT (NUDIX family)